VVREADQTIEKELNMKVLITGAAGYLGHGLIVANEPHHTLRLMDVAPIPNTRHEMVVASVEDYTAVKEAVRGVDAIIIAHMAPRKPGVYDTPEKPFDITVKGTANLYAAAHELGVKRVALISSIGVVEGHRQRGEYLRNDLPYDARGFYGLTKVCQEIIAQQYFREHGIRSAILRPSYIQDADTMADKYGKVANEVNWHYIDRRDIGKAARLAIEKDDMACEIFYLLGHPKSVDHAEMKPVYERLGWKPDHDFTHMPYEGTRNKK
jgi:nucleoside-diphosphate-sugar epimerase